MNDKEKKHARTKLILRIAGCCMILAGLALAVTGMISLFSFEEDAPDLFWMAMIGFPVLVVGIFLLLVSFQRAIASYAKNEAVPVVNEAAEEIAPAVQAIAGAAQTIRQHRPKLNIAAYHKNEDFFQLPLLVHTLCPDYRLYLRHHPYVPAWDTNLYAVCP